MVGSILSLKPRPVALTQCASVHAAHNLKSYLIVTPLLTHTRAVVNLSTVCLRQWRFAVGILTPLAIPATGLFEHYLIFPMNEPSTFIGDDNKKKQQEICLRLLSLRFIMRIIGIHYR